MKINFFSIKLFLILIFFNSIIFSQTAFELSSLEKANQIVVVINSDWDCANAQLRYFERKNNSSNWKTAGKNIPAVLGRSGFGVGDENFNLDGPKKKEGDGRSPAGVFKLLSAFGFEAEEKISWIKLPYFQITSNIECVDDIESPNYNMIVDRSKEDAINWKSSEKMTKINQYKFGIFVDYNTKPVKAGNGSCIFVHIWGGPNSSTSGCTALSENNLKDLLKWLDPEKKPVLVQFPIKAYKKLKDKLNLPEIVFDSTKF